MAAWDSAQMATSTAKNRINNSFFGPRNQAIKFGHALAGEHEHYRTAIIQLYQSVYQIIASKMHVIAGTVHLRIRKTRRAGNAHPHNRLSPRQPDHDPSH